VILDSWTFQSVGELFADGYDPERTGVLIATEQAHAFIPMANGDLQLHALIDLLTNIVLREELILDPEFTDAWEPVYRIFDPIRLASVIDLSGPLGEMEALQSRRAMIVHRLCTTDSLRTVQAENEAAYYADKSTIHPFESQVIWGGAGMLARSDLSRTPYVGHPIRQRFIESTNAWRPPQDPTRDLVELVNEHKASIYSTISDGEGATRAKLMLPSVAAEVITKANRPDQLFTIALEYRDRYKKLREWLGEMRTAMEEEDTTKLMSYKRTLNMLAKDVARTIGSSEAPLSSLDITLGFINVSIPMPNVRDAFNRRFSIRHDLMNMVKAPAGERAMEKLGRMFGKPA